MLPKEYKYRARFGLGDKATALLPELHFESKPQPDLFHAALGVERALFIEDAKATKLRGRLPMWWLSLLGSACSFCLIPLHIKQSPVAFLYLDWASNMQTADLSGSRMEALTKVRQIIMNKMTQATRPAT
ncbi:MAG: hypothetical protein EOO38_24765 [Cytophagaceae bacterium]|nr:MAG: hypothetical protein EOO38_24765 [Cytophagaceae bacterium]